MLQQHDDSFAKDLKLLFKIINNISYMGLNKKLIIEDKNEQ